MSSTTNDGAAAACCNACLKPQEGSEPLKVCSVCGTVRYCSVECQKADWATGSKPHKLDCTRRAVSQLIAGVRRNDAAAVRRLAGTSKRVLNGRVDYETPPNEDSGETSTLGKWTALHECVRSENAEMIKILTEHDGCNLEIKDVDQETPLFVASSSRNYEIVMALLKAGANPNAKAKDGWSCLMMASRSGDYEVTKALLEAGASLSDGRDMFGRTALDLVNHFRSGQGGVTVVEGESYEQALAKYERLYTLMSGYYS